MSIKALNQNTVRYLNSGQSIIDLETIVKELIENSIDANSTSIELTFIENGLEMIQVKDNGIGIFEEDRSFVAKRHYTSKIVEFSDLEEVMSFGFRGEAVSSICSVSQKIVLTTKTKEDIIGKQYYIDHEGNISNSKPSNLIASSGTIVQVFKPFYDIPVRRQIAQKNGSQNIKKIHELIIRYALSFPSIRFSYSSKLIQQQSSWTKPVTKSIETSISIMFSVQLSNMVERYIEKDINHPTLTIDLIIPKPNSDPNIIFKDDRVFVYVNQRPINYVKSELKDLVALIRSRYKNMIGLGDSFNKKNPFMYIDIQIAPNEYDVNIEPNKTIVLLHNKQAIYDLVLKTLEKTYPSKINKFFQSNKDQRPKISLPDELINKTISNNEESTQMIEAIEEDQNKANESFALTPEELHRQLINEITNTIPEETIGDYTDQSNLLSGGTQKRSMMEKEVEEKECIFYPSDNCESKKQKSTSPKATSIKSSTVSAEDVDRSFSFSMLSDSEVDELISDDECIKDKPHKAKQLLKNNSSKNSLLNPTIDHWQIDEELSCSQDFILSKDINIQNSISVLPSVPEQINDRVAEFPVVDEVDNVGSTKSTMYNAKAKRANTAENNTITKRLKTISLLNAGSRKENVQMSTYTASTPLSTNIHLSGNKASSSCFFNINSHKISDHKEAFKTTNKFQVIQCSIKNIKINYPKQKERINKLYRIRTQDYLLNSKDFTLENNEPFLNLIKMPFDTNGYDLAIYVKGIKDNARKANEICIFQQKGIAISTIYESLIKNHKFICKNSLDRPVEIHFSNEDPLCPVILSLSSKQVTIDNDFHGNEEETFSDITDEYVCFNGFKVRWRKDSYSDRLIVQFTSIYFLSSGYGPNDFRELLYLIKSGNTKKRPKKIEQYLWTLAAEKYKSQQNQDEASDMKALSDKLNKLIWQEDQETGKEVGCINNKIVACKLK